MVRNTYAHILVIVESALFCVRSVICELSGLFFLEGGHSVQGFLARSGREEQRAKNENTSHLNTCAFFLSCLIAGETRKQGGKNGP